MYSPHPLFPRPDLPEDRDIVFITLERRDRDGHVERCPEDVPRDDLTSWGQVQEWWGGGDYRAIGKNAQREACAVFPSVERWVHVDGEPRPLVRRSDTATAPRRAG
jgi:hypothetical protein